MTAGCTQLARAGYLRLGVGWVVGVGGEGDDLGLEPLGQWEGVDDGLQLVGAFGLPEAEGAAVVAAPEADERSLGGVCAGAALLACSALLDQVRVGVVRNRQGEDG